MSSKQVSVISGKMRGVFKDDEKIRHVNEFAKSKMSQNKYAEMIGVSGATFSNWNREFKDCAYTEQPDQKASGSFKSLEEVLKEQEKLKADHEKMKQENQSLKAEIYHMKAYLGHQAYQSGKQLLISNTEY